MCLTWCISTLSGEAQLAQIWPNADKVDIFQFLARRGSLYTVVPLKFVGLRDMSGHIKFIITTLWSLRIRLIDISDPNLAKKAFLVRLHFLWMVLIRLSLKMKNIVFRLGLLSAKL